MEGGSWFRVLEHRSVLSWDRVLLKVFMVGGEAWAYAVSKEFKCSNMIMDGASGGSEYLRHEGS